MSVFAILLYQNNLNSEEREEKRRVNIRRRQIRDFSNLLSLDENCFVDNFRVNKEGFIYLLNEIESKITSTTRASAVPNLLKLACLLRFCAQGSYQLSVGNDLNLGLAQPTVSLILKEICQVFEDNICPKWIKFIHTTEEKNHVKLCFYEKSGIPGIIGCADGTHVRITAPKKDIQHLYYNRKGFYSLNVLIVCDNEMKIRYLDARFPGSCHDSRVWNLSSLKSKLEEDCRNGETNTWLLGDAGYSLSPYFITPFRNAEEHSVQARFNKKHSQARIIIERTIGVLKNRFRCLLGYRALHYSPETATKIVNICAALHNICVHYKVDQNFEYMPVEIEDELTVPEIEHVDGEQIRNEILNAMNL